MARRLFIFIGGVENDDYAWIMKNAGVRTATSPWSSVRDAKPGDRVLIYVAKPHSALIAEASVLTAARRGRPGDYAYRAKIGRLRLLPNQVTIAELRRRFPRWGWLRYPRGKARVPKEYAEHLWSIVHETRVALQILISSPDDAQRLEELAATGEKDVWWAPKETRAGDTVLFYVAAPTSAIMASGRATSSARPTNSKWWECDVADVRMLDAPITLTELRRMFPRWKWLRSVNMFSYVSPAQADSLRKRVTKSTAPTSLRRVVGGGFGDSETNRQVERAAISAAKRYLKRRGYAVKSRESECLGYDLEAKKADAELHVEVKGVSGAATQFVITRGEVNCADKDSAFRLMVVTDARSPRPTVHTPLSGQTLREKFELKPIAFMALEKDRAR